MNKWDGYKNIMHEIVILSCVIGIVSLESLNILVLKHNSTTLTIVFVILAGIGGYSGKYLKDFVRIKKEGDKL